MSKLTFEEKVGVIEDILDCLDDNELVWVHNDYCEKCGYGDDIVYPMSEFDDMMDGRTPSEIASDVQGTDFGINDDWFWFNGYGNLVSGYPSELADTHAMAKYAIENDEDLGCSEVRDQLNEWEDEEEEEEEEEE